MPMSSGWFFNSNWSVRALTHLRPERWQHVPEKVAELPGVYSNLLSFLAGPRYHFLLY